MNWDLVPTFDEFADNYKTKVNVKKFYGFEEIYNTLRDKNYLFLAICLSFAEMPALAASSSHLEAIGDFTPDFEVDFDDAAVKQTIGIMQKAVLEPFGFVPYKQKKIKDRFSLKFSQAACYRLDKSKIKIPISELAAEIESDHGYSSLVY